MKRWVYILIVGWWTTRAGAQNKGLDAALLHRAQAALTTVIVHDIFSPPVASRIYLYANMAAYEAALPAQKKYSDLQRSIASFPVISAPVNRASVRYDLSALYAFMQTARRFVFSEEMLGDSLQVFLKKYKRCLTKLSN